VSICLAKAAIFSFEALRAGSSAVKAFRNCCGSGRDLGLRPRLEGSSVVCFRLFRTCESTALSRKLLTRLAAERLAACRDLEARQLGGMDDESILNLSWSAPSITATHRDLSSLTTGINCSLATSSMEKRASFDQKSMESERAMPSSGMSASSKRSSAGPGLRARVVMVQSIRPTAFWEI